MRMMPAARVPFVDLFLAGTQDKFLAESPQRNPLVPYPNIATAVLNVIAITGAGITVVVVAPTPPPSLTRLEFKEAALAACGLNVECQPTKPLPPIAPNVAVGNGCGGGIVQVGGSGTTMMALLLLTCPEKNAGLMVWASERNRAPTLQNLDFQVHHHQ
jgi:hypothetical protein